MDFPPEDLKQMYGTMVLIRLFESSAIEIFAQRMRAGDFPGALHSSEGQEAIAVLSEPPPELRPPAPAMFAPLLQTREVAQHDDQRACGREPIAARPRPMAQEDGFRQPLVDRGRLEGMPGIQAA